MNCVTGSVAYVTQPLKSMEGLLSLLSGEKVVMRNKSIVFAAVAGVLLAGSASAEGLFIARSR